MSAGLKGDLSRLKAFERGLRELPRVAAQRVAAASATTITTLAIRTYDAGENAYGDKWDPGAEGQAVDLRESGALAGGVRYVAIGTKLRAVLTVPYAKYQIGKRPIFPRAGAKLPTSYRNALATAVARVVPSVLGTKP